MAKPSHSQQPGSMVDGSTGQTPYIEISNNNPIYSEMNMVIISTEPHHEFNQISIDEDDAPAIPENRITLAIEPDLSHFGFKYSTIVTSNAVLTSIIFGYSLSVLNSCMNAIALHFEWCGNAWDSSCKTSQFYQAVINAILFLGAVTGSIISGLLVPLGRRWSLQLGCWIFILGGIIGSLALGPFAWIQLMIARILVGIALGIVTVITPLYISEMTPASSRGFFGAMHQTLISVGIFFGIALGLLLSPNSSNVATYILSSFDRWWWRFMLVFQCVPAAFCLIGFTFICMDETPHYLIDNERTIEAAKTIMHIHGAANVNEIEGTLLEISQAVYEARGLTQITLREAIKEKYYRFGLLVGLFLSCIQQLSGINVIISSSDFLFAMAGLTPDTVTLTSTFMAFVNVLASAAAAFFIENLGRRLLLLWGLAGQVLFMVPIGLLRYMNENHTAALPDILIITPTQSTWYSVIGTIGFVVSFSFALGPIVWIYVSEIFPVEIRGAALGACGATNWITAFVIVFLGRFLHITTAFILFGFICFVGLIFTYLWVIETKGSSIENSPVSPQSLRSKSRLIQNSRSGTQYVTLDDIREKIRSPSPLTYSMGPQFHSSNSRLTDAYGVVLERPCSTLLESGTNLSSLGVDPCLMDDDVEDVDDERIETKLTYLNGQLTRIDRIDLPLISRPQLTNAQAKQSSRPNQWSSEANLLQIRSKKSNNKPSRINR